MTVEHLPQQLLPTNPANPYILVVQFKPGATLDSASSIQQKLVGQKVNCGPVHLDRYARPAAIPVFDTTADTIKALEQTGLNSEVVEGKRMADYLPTSDLPNPSV